MDVSPVSHPLPHMLPPFRLVTQLGRGGFAPVWLAEEVHDGKKLRDVALKLFVLQENVPRGSAQAVRWRESILDEARALCRVEHPNVVRFYALCRDDESGLVGLAMEHVAGKNLDVWLDEHGPFDDRTVLDVGISVAWALAAVHQAGLVHRDVKPSNIIAGPTGYKLIDFGIVADAPPSLKSVSGSAASDVAAPLAGTHGYVAPEYFQPGAGPTPAGDLYALGVTLFKLKRGQLPRPAAPESLAQSGTPSRRATVEIDSLDRLIHLLIEPQPHVRPHHADWVARELERLRGRLVPRALHPWDAVGESTPPAASPHSADAGGEKAPPAAQLPRVDHAAHRHDAENTPHGPRAHPPIVGRSDTLAVLDRVAHEAAEGHVRFVLLTGPLGVGRTRLLDAAVERAGVVPERVLRVRCVPERRSPLRPLIRALETLPDGGNEAFGLFIDAIERALAPAVLPGGHQGDEALEAVEDALLWAAKDAPIVVAIDDVQWGDAYTLRLVQLFVERAEMGWPARLVVLAAARDEPNPSPPLRALVDRVRGRSRPGVSHLGLGPLGAGEAAALAQAVCPVEPALEQAVVRGSGGVPYFVVHALRAWYERGAIAWQKGGWRAADDRVLREDVPGVADLLEARLASYFEPESAAFRAALRALAVVALFGGGLKIEILFACAGGDEDIVEAALETLTDADILAVSGDRQEYGFAQEMVRQAVLNLLRQRPWFHRLHRTLLDTVAAHPDARGDAAFLATGYEKLGERDRARIWLGHAMQSARESGLFGEAAAFGDRLAALTADPGARAEVEIEIVRALVHGRQFEDAKARLARIDADAAVLGPRHAQSGARELKRRILHLRIARGRSEPADDRTLVADADAPGDPVLACEARLALAGVAQGQRARALADEAVALAQQAADPVLEFQARQMRVELIHAMGCQDVDQAERDLRRELDIAIATSSIPQQIDIEGDLVVLVAEAGRVQEAIEQLRRLAQQARSLGMRGQLRILSHNLATCLLRAGRFAEAAEEATRNAELAAEAGDPMLRCTALSLRAQALMQTGDLELALQSVTEAEELQRARDDRMRAHTLACRAEILWPLGRTQQALQDARAAREVAERYQEEGFLVTALLCEALYLARLGQTTPEHLQQALARAHASGVVQRAILRSLIDQAEQWLAGRQREPAKT